MDIYNIFTSKIPRSIENFDPRAKKLITFLNPHSYTLAFKNAELFEDFDIIASDGILVVKVLNWLKATDFKIKRYSCDMTSVVPYVFDIAIKNNLSVYFFGADADSVGKTVNVFKENFRDLKIAGYRDGYFKDANERSEVINQIVTLNPDMIFVGMGTILQEGMALDLRKAGYKGAVYTCGGFLHQTKTEINFYPKFIDKVNLRFFYRMFKENGFFKRSVKTYPMFMMLIMRHVLHIEDKSQQQQVTKSYIEIAPNASKNDDVYSKRVNFNTAA